VYRQVIDLVLAGRPHGLFDGVGDVVELQVQEDLPARAPDWIQYFRPEAGELLQAELVDADVFGGAGDKAFQGAGVVGVVER